MLKKRYSNYLLKYGNFLSAVYIAVFNRPFKLGTLSKIVQRQIYFTAIQALGITIFSGLLTGITIMVQSNDVISNIAGNKLIYSILVSVITIELGGIIPSLIIIARSGTAITTEIGNMSVNHEIEALISLKINPIEYLVITRVIGVITSLLILVLFFNLSTFISAGFISSVFLNRDLTDFISLVIGQLTLLDIFTAFIKANVFGIIIATVACFHGLEVNRASTEVPQQTSKAVIISIGFIILFDIFLSLLRYEVLS